MVAAASQAFEHVGGRQGSVTWVLALFTAVCASGMPANAAGAQRSPAGAGSVTSAAGPPRPVPPEVITRDGNGRVVVRAIHLSEPLRIDGNLDEEVYRSTPPIGDFVQTVPREGQPATERTEAWVMFDGNYIYIAGKCYDSAPPDKWTANELRRDTNQLRQNDNFVVSLDTFHDRRNSYLFYANPLGGFSDLAITDESTPNLDWNPVWTVRTGRFPGGWTAEMAIPFKSIRYKSGVDQDWGLQLRRSVRRKNEWSHLTLLTAAAGGPTAIFRVSLYATLVGLDLPPASRNMDIKPYAISRVTTDTLRNPPLSNHPEGDIGLDMKYGLNANLTADITVNTDFAQVEVDEQQVNRTRFSLSFPEKRDFFLEGRGIFDFGRGGVGSGGMDAANSTLTPSLFYSRRIGLNGNRVIPIDGGGRVTGKSGQFNIGLLNIQAGRDDVSATPATNFTVVRVKRDILRRSSIGLMATNRSNSAVVPGASNQAYGADAFFSFFQNVGMGGYYARSDTPGLKQDNDSYQARFDYAADRYGVQAQYLKVGDNFGLPDVLYQ